jgi:hypothetical protein
VAQIQAGGPPGASRPRPTGRGPGFGGVRPARILAGVLLLAGIVLPLWVHSYARETPRLWGFPFFYWYQLIWVFIAAILVGGAFLLVGRDERIHRTELTGGAVLPEHDAIETEQLRDGERPA